MDYSQFLRGEVPEVEESRARSEGAIDEILDGIPADLQFPLRGMVNSMTASVEDDRMRDMTKVLSMMALGGSLKKEKPWDKEANQETVEERKARWESEKAASLKTAKERYREVKAQVKDQDKNGGKRSCANCGAEKAKKDLKACS